VRLVVTTWNLQGSNGVDVDGVAAHVQAQGTDVLLLQEVQRRQARQLAEALEARSLSWAFKHWPVKIPAEGMAVVGVSRPLRARARGITRRLRWWSWRRRIVQLAQLAPDPGEGGLDGLAIANVHLSPHDHAAPSRARELASVVALLGPIGRGWRAVVAGDLNMGSATVGAQLTQHEMVDVWTSTQPEGAGGGTIWVGVPRHRPANRRIDQVWVSAAVTAIAAHVPSPGDGGWEVFGGLSDHLPLTVTLDG
jgi:endonuclease/exonuclease/phosphatase family metal-dependent hydrolase